MAGVSLEVFGAFLVVFGRFEDKYKLSNLPQSLEGAINGIDSLDTFEWLGCEAE